MEKVTSIRIKTDLEVLLWCITFVGGLLGMLHNTNTFYILLGLGGATGGLFMLVKTVCEVIRLG